MWEINGVRGAGDRPPTAGNFSGVGLVVGSAPSVWNDLARAPSGDIMVLNRMAVLVERPVRHLASLHHDHVEPLAAFRRKLWRLSDGHVHTHSAKGGAGIENVWDLEGGCCFSGIFGAVVMLALGYERVILCGCPQDASGYVWQPGCTDIHQNRGACIEWGAWAANVFRGRVKSMSGRTREWLGAPDGV